MKINGFRNIRLVAVFLPVGLKHDPSFMSDLFPTYQSLFVASLDPGEIRAFKVSPCIPLFDGETCDSQKRGGLRSCKAEGTA